MTPYFTLRVDIEDEHVELAQLFLHESGCLGLEVRDGANAPAAGSTRLLAFYEDREAARSARDELAREHPGAHLELREEVQRDWSSEWRQSVRAVQVGRLWVGPPWRRAESPADALAIVIEPKMAFGTGDHPTTLLCLATLEPFLRAHPNASVLDVGTGTGVLAIAAKRLGAGRVVGIDNDPIAIDIAEETAHENAARVELSTTPVDRIEGEFDLVLANILANTLIELARPIARRTAKLLVLAGVLAHQADEVEAAYVQEGLVPEARAHEGEWVRLTLTRS